MRISEINKNEAIRNIRLKISLLKKISSSSDFPTGEYFPKTLRQFNNWDLSQNTLECRKKVASIKRNANDTLNKYQDLKSEVVASLHASILAHSNSPPSNRIDRIGKLKEDISSLKNISVSLSYIRRTKKSNLFE